ncbi:MAG: sigma-70 family RNA polymerase sigma factor [Pseudobdellovibrionaceae bacterium]|jgi:RNA polymerase sigma-70 factor (ECF subfamily)|nr:sigma-70 family RNA polymerase sigma factor [Pseudobdellovibrionaceae bacterium]
MPIPEDDQDKVWQELAVKAQSGDTSAYHDLLKSSVPVIRRSIGRTLPNSDVIDDVVQDVLLSIHKALHTYDPERPFLPWLMAIISFRRTDFLRQHYATRGNKQVSIETVDLPDYLNSSESAVHFGDVEKALDSLPQKQKEVVELLKIKGYSTKEVSEKTGLSESAVKVTMHRALQKLKEKLA